MSINILPGTSKTLASMKGQKFKPHEGEGLVYIKLVMIKPETMEEGDPEQLVEDSEGVILCGQLDKIRNQIDKWFQDAVKEYTDDKS